MKLSFALIHTIVRPVLFVRLTRYTRSPSCFSPSSVFPASGSGTGVITVGEISFGVGAGVGVGFAVGFGVGDGVGVAVGFAVGDGVTAGDCADAGVCVPAEA